MATWNSPAACISTARIAGNVRADPVEGSSLSVSETGSIDGNVEAGNVMLNGAVRGDIIARGRVVLGATARVQGNVYYGVIEMTLGAQIMGKLTRLIDQRRRGSQLHRPCRKVRPDRRDRLRLIDQRPKLMSTPEAVVETPVLQFTDAAARKVGDLIKGEGNPNLMLRVFVQGGGCSGLHTDSSSTRQSRTAIPASKTSV